MKPPYPLLEQHSTRRQIGFTLVELMVALAIGSFLILGATQVYIQGRTTFRINESIARLHEDARYALQLMEPDIRMASYFGMQSRPDRIQNAATSTDPIPAGLGVANDCGTNWTIDLATPIEATNNAYTWTCAATGGAQAGSDALIVRRVAEDPTTGALNGNTMYLQSARVLNNQLFVGSSGIPAGFTAANSLTHELVVSGYYVSAQSSLGANIPSLRRRFLDNGAGGPTLSDEEILPGVEDLQIEFGIDTDLPGTVNRGSVNRYVNPDNVIIDPTNVGFDPNAQILAVRLWLLVRAELAENGYVDANVGNIYAYADRDWGGAPAPTNVRRVLVSKTIFLRNARSTI